MKSVYVTDSPIAPDGHGGAVVGYHELQALTRVSDVGVYQRVGKLYLEDKYPQNPFMYDYFIASIINPKDVELAHFYGSSFNLTAKMLPNAKKFVTVPAHNLEESLREWGNFKYFTPPPQHLTDDVLFRYLVHGLLGEITVVCPSNSSAKYLKEKLGLTATIIPHGTDIPERFNIDRKDFQVLHISQFGPDKGQIYLLQAWKKFSKGVLSIVSSNMNDKITEYTPDTIVKNFVTKEEKEELYLNASVYVQPSVTEGWGLSVGEAMSHGTPVIVTEGAGACDMVVDGREGFVVPIRNPDAIAEKLQYFFDNPSEVRRMGHNARLTAERFSWDKIEAMYTKLWSGKDWVVAN